MSAGTAAPLAAGITGGDFSLGILQTCPGTAPGAGSLSVLGAFVSKKGKKSQINVCVSQHRDKIKPYAGVMLRMNRNMTLHPTPRKNYIKYFMLTDNIDKSTLYSKINLIF